MKSNILSGLVILISLFFYAFSVQAQEKPEIFVQLGHIKRMGLRVLVWVNLYLLEHTGKDFQPKIIFFS